LDLLETSSSVPLGETSRAWAMRGASTTVSPPVFATWARNDSWEPALKPREAWK
jgi:hypothetical protein